MENLTSKLPSKVLYKINCSKIFHTIHFGLGKTRVLRIFQYSFFEEYLRVPDSVSSNESNFDRNICLRNNLYQLTNFTPKRENVMFSSI